jgi:hypothetical protein
MTPENFKAIALPTPPYGSGGLAIFVVRRVFGTIAPAYST